MHYKQLVAKGKANNSARNITVESIFSGVNMFLARVRFVIAQPKARFEMSSDGTTKNIFAFKDINSLTILITLEGI